MKRYNDNNDEGYFLEVQVQCLEKLHQLHIELPFLPAKMKIEKNGKLVVNLHDKEEYVIHIRSYVINIRLQTSLKNVHIYIQLNQEAQSIN